jgi:hypothetical protein
MRLFLFFTVAYIILIGVDVSSFSPLVDFGRLLIGFEIIGIGLVFIKGAFETVDLLQGGYCAG